MTVLAVLAVLESTLPSCCLSYKIQHNEATVVVLTVSAVVAVSVMTATPLKPNPPLFRHPEDYSSNLCAYLKYDLYDFFRGVFGPASCSFSCIQGPKTPLKKSYRSYFRRAQIR